MRRAGAKGSGQYVRISWHEAVDEITARFAEITREWGAEAILPYHYGGSNGLLSDGGMDALYFARLGASRLAKTICAAPTTEYDVVVLNGRVMDPETKLDAVRNVGIGHPRTAGTHAKVLRLAREEGVGPDARALDK